MRIAFGPHDRGAALAQIRKIDVTGFTTSDHYDFHAGKLR